MLVFKVTIKDARVEREAQKIAHKDVARDFIENAEKWVSLPNTRVAVRFEKKKRKQVKDKTK